jgi:2-keto-3-deoxy-L-rhamnonate aldolase RhmA
MRKSKMLAKFRSGSSARVCAMGHVLPFFVRYAAHYNYDGIWLDLEHRNMTDREVQYLIALCRTADIDCMVRPPTREAARLYRYLEDGAAGFLMPLVSDAETAYEIVQAVKFPPVGNRGLDGAGQDGDFGIDAWREGGTFTDDANQETFIITQVETLEAVANAEEIASIPGIDGLFVGPADLGLRIRKDPMSTMPSLEAAIEAVAAAAEAQGKIWGIAVGTKEEFLRYRDMGAKLIPWGGDFALREVLRRSSEDLGVMLGD